MQIKFPPKVTRIREEIHEFERMGLVSEYFLVHETYDTISTFSMQGLARPADDKYYPDFPESDPVYAEWGYKKTINQLIKGRRNGCEGLL